MRAWGTRRKGQSPRDAMDALAYRCAMRAACRPGLLLLLPVVLFLAGCAAPFDSEQLRLCRQVLPALHPEGTALREIRVSPAALGKAGLRIDYAAREPGAANRVHVAACGFGGTTFEADRLDLVAVESDGVPLGAARLLYLKRFWLAAAEAELPPPDQLSSLPRLPTGVAYALQQLVNALALASIYALLATAYSLIYGLVGRLNLAFGEITVLGAYGAIGSVAAVVALGFTDPLGGLAVALAVAAGLSAGWSAVVGRLVVAPLHARHRLGQPVAQRLGLGHPPCADQAASASRS